MASKSLTTIAILDDYQGVALEMADWSTIESKAQITVFKDHLADEHQVAERLAPFNILCVMRERTPLKRSLLEQLPNLKLIVSTGTRNASIDLKAAEELGIEVANTGYSSSPTIELTWALILASARHIVEESNSVRDGGWQKHLGADLGGKTLGIIGLGNIGSQVAKIGIAFGMKVIAWSENLTVEKATAAGAELVTKEQLLKQADFISIHIVLSDRSRGTIGAPELALMKKSAHLINTSRGPIVDESALLQALSEGKIAGAAVDVFDLEPLPKDSPFRTAKNLLATPHIGYVSKGLYERYFVDTVEKISDWLDKHKE